MNKSETQGYVQELREEINKLKKENSDLKIENAELHCEMQAMNVFHEGMSEEPIEVASILINASYTRNKGDLERKIDRAFGNNSDTVTENIYSISELRQIAEHLLIYCNANGEGEE